MTRPGSLLWFARHEMRVQWRDLDAMLSGGRSTHYRALIIVVLTIAIIGHLFARILVGPWASGGIAANAHTLAQLTGTGILFATMSLSQAMESVTRAYYTRHDLDLILSSPASPERLFTIRTATIALTTAVMTGILAAPFINILILYDGAHWLAAYAMIIAISVLTTALAVVIVLALFRLIGAKRTRLVAQILAALIGAALIVGIQIAVILSSGETMPISQVLSGHIARMAPQPENLVWLPARAAMGNLPALAICLVISLGIGWFAIRLSAPSFASLASASSAQPQGRVIQKRVKAFSYRSQAQILRRKEWLLLWRDPWLLSQSLMQLFYLLPPAILLWMNYGSSGGTLPIVIAIVVMACGQLAGGLAWLTISGEDAHDLVATAPITRRRLYQAKIEAVIGAIAVPIAPICIAIAFLNPTQALIALAGLLLAAGSAIFIQLMFRTRARRAQFARRQTASRIATILEALVSITWAGSTGIAAANLFVGAVAALPALIIVFAIWLVRRKHQIS